MDNHVLIDWRAISGTPLLHLYGGYGGHLRCEYPGMVARTRTPISGCGNWPLAGQTCGSQRASAWSWHDLNWVRVVRHFAIKLERCIIGIPLIAGRSFALFFWRAECTVL